MAGLYVHVPFRRASRRYDESDYVVTDNSDFPRFETALCRELRFYAPKYAADEKINTVYAGGGRPSLLPLSTVHAILTSLVEVFDASAFEEATAEVSPADATARYLHGLKRLGFDRISLAVLSYFPGPLQILDAPHSPADAVRALQFAREAGFETLSVDLSFGIQPFDLWEATLRETVAMRVPHVTITEAPSVLLDEDPSDRLAEQFEFAMTYLQSEGYEQYELTHFAQTGHRSAHQQNYYAHGNYLGVGPSAETFWWPNRSSSRARRWSNVSDFQRYVTLLESRHPPVSYRQTLDQTSLAQEYVFLRLRTQEGLALDRLEKQYGVNLLAQKKDVLDRLVDEGLIHAERSTVRLTNRGRLLADAITKRLLPS